MWLTAQPDFNAKCEQSGSSPDRIELEKSPFLLGWATFSKCPGQSPLKGCQQAGWFVGLCSLIHSFSHYLLIIGWVPVNNAKWCTEYKDAWLLPSWCLNPDLYLLYEQQYKASKNKISHEYCCFLTLSPILLDEKPKDCLSCEAISLLMRLRFHSLYLEN